MQNNQKAMQCGMAWYAHNWLAQTFHRKQGSALLAKPEPSGGQLDRHNHYKPCPKQLRMQGRAGTGHHRQCTTCQRPQGCWARRVGAHLLDNTLPKMALLRWQRRQQKRQGHHLACLERSSPIRRPPQKQPAPRSRPAVASQLR
jgi:hypothetical protein